MTSLTLCQCVVSHEMFIYLLEIQEKSTDRNAASDTEKKKEKKKSKKKKHKTNVLDHEVCNKVKKKKKHKHKHKSDHEHNQEIKVDLTETDLSDKSKR